jgi:hypothetical protein
VQGNTEAQTSWIFRGDESPPLDSEFQTLLQTYMVILAASSVNLNIGKLQLKVEQYLVEPKVLSKIGHFPKIGPFIFYWRPSQKSVI